MQSNLNRTLSTDAKIFLIAVIAFILVAYAPDSFSQTEFQKTCTNVNLFVSNLVKLLGFISIGVVTVAIIFAGYQISFAHKRFSDVAPILIGGLLIGGAGQIAKWFMTGVEGVGGC